MEVWTSFQAVCIQRQIDRGHHRASPTLPGKHLGLFLFSWKKEAAPTNRPWKPSTVDIMIFGWRMALLVGLGEWISRLLHEPEGSPGHKRSSAHFQLQTIGCAVWDFHGKEGKIVGFSYLLSSLLQCRVKLSQVMEEHQPTKSTTQFIVSVQSGHKPQPCIEIEVQV